MGLDYLVGTPFSGLKRYLGKMIVKEKYKQNGDQQSNPGDTVHSDDGILKAADFELDLR